MFTPEEEAALSLVPGGPSSAKQRLDLNITFEVTWKKPPNQHFCRVTPVLSSPDGVWVQRDEPMMCTDDELDELKSAVVEIYSQRFNVISAVES